MRIVEGTLRPLPRGYRGYLYPRDLPATFTTMTDPDRGGWDDMRSPGITHLFNLMDEMNRRVYDAVGLPKEIYEKILG